MAKGAWFHVVTRSQTKGLQPLPNADADLFGTVGKDKKVKDKDNRKSIGGKIRKSIWVKDSLPKIPDPELELINSRWQVPDNFRELQKADVTLQPLFQKM